MIIYKALYNCCVHESSYATISIHKTKEGAEKAIEIHKAKEKEEFDKIYKDNNEFNFKFGEHENWDIAKTELLD